MESVAPPRFRTLLLGLFSAVALLLSVVGIYGVMSYAVAQRKHELGIRMALGATARDVLKLIISQGLKLALLGVAIGSLVAFALARWMESLLFGVRPTDPLTFGVIVVVLLCVALIFSLIDALLLKSLPVKDPQELVVFSSPRQGGNDYTFNYPLIERFNQANHSFTGIIASDNGARMRMSTIVSATLLMIGAAAFAGYLPARRASRVDPMVALRDE